MAEAACQQQLHSLGPTCVRRSARTSHPPTALGTGTIGAHDSQTGAKAAPEMQLHTHLPPRPAPCAPPPSSAPAPAGSTRAAEPPFHSSREDRPGLALPAETTQTDRHLPHHLHGWRRHSPLMTSCRFTWPLGRLCRVPGGTSSRQPGGSSGSSSRPDRPGSPSSPGSGLWDRGLVKARLRAAQRGDVTPSVHPLTPPPHCHGLSLSPSWSLTIWSLPVPAPRRPVLQSSPISRKNRPALSWNHCRPLVTSASIPSSL